jgi:hypothetical protein
VVEEDLKTIGGETVNQWPETGMEGDCIGSKCLQLTVVREKAMRKKTVLKNWCVVFPHRMFTLIPHNLNLRFRFTVTAKCSKRHLLSYVTRKRRRCTKPPVQAMGLTAEHKWISFISYHILWPIFLLYESLVSI